MAFYKSSKDFEDQIREFILSMLSEDEKSGCEKWLKKYEAIAYKTSLYLPQGCKKLGWNNFTIVDIEYRVLYGTIQKICSRVRRKKSIYNEIASIDTVLIYRDTPNVLLPERIYDFLKVYTDIELFNRVKEKEVISDDDEKIKKCKEAFKNKSCTLFIGAGVSISAGLPGWNELLLRMKNSLCNGNVNSRSDVMKIKRACDMSTIIEARYLKEIAKNRGDRFIVYVKNALYLNEANLQGSLLNSVANIIAYKYKLNSQQKAIKIITYNYDDLLEYALHVGGLTKIKIIDGPINKCTKNYVPIYHVHGIIPKYYYDGNLYVDQIVLSEEDYQELYDKQNKWVNTIQRNALNESTCIFIGASMNDPNLRRLLYITKKENDIPHYAFLKRIKLSNNSLTTQNEKTMNEIFQELGVNIIWYDEHENLPGLLGNLLV